MRTVYVRTAAPRQVIDHFGASGCWSLDPIGAAWDEENRERIADLLFSREKGIGLSLLRVNLGAGDPDPSGYSTPWRRAECLQDGPGAPVRSDRQAGQRWFLRAARRRGMEKSLAFVNSPPVWLTRNGRAFGDKAEQGRNLKPGAERAFGRYLADVLRHFEAEGLPFDYVSPVNEPNWDWTGGQEGCSYGAADLPPLAAAVAAELKAAGVRAEQSLGDLGDLRALLDGADYRDYRRVTSPNVRYARPGRAEYARALLGGGVPAAAVKHVAGHSYWTDSSPHDLAELRAALRRTLDRHAPGLPYWQTEYCVMEHRRDLGMDTALRVARVIHHDLAVADAAAWSWWLAVSQGDYKDGLVYTDYRHDGSGGLQNVLPSKTLWALGNWSRFVRPGARRVEAATDALPDELLATAFLGGADGGKGEERLTVVLVNPTEAPVTVLLRTDRPLGPALTPHVTDAGRDLERTAPVAPSAVEVPARSVVTLVCPVVGSPPAGGPATVPLAPAARRERAAPAGEPALPLYAVRCGGGDARPLPDADGGRRNSRADQPFGRDPGTGYRWGYETYGAAGGRDEVGGDSARWEEGDRPGEGVTYRFDVPAGVPLRVELAFHDFWGDPGRRMDVFVQGRRVEEGLVPGGSGTVVRRYETGPVTGKNDGPAEMEVRVCRSKDNDSPGGDPLISAVRIEQG